MKQESTFGARLRSLMEESGLSYEQMGARLDMNPQTLNRYVLGQREPKIGTATKYAKATVELTVNAIANETINIKGVLMAPRIIFW